MHRLAEDRFSSAELHFHPQCFASFGHFAGDDATRADALVELANDPAFDAVWFARGGYGACRIAENVSARLESAASDKIYLGYSDAGNLLGKFYREGVGRPVHGAMPTDIKRVDGDQAVARALRWMVERNVAAVDPAVADEARPVAAFNLVTLAMMVGTPLMPDLSGHVLLVEEVSEHLYAFDRAFFHVGAHLADCGLAGIRLGRVSDVPKNDRDFGETAEQIARRWCDHFSIPFLGDADIGHDSDNHIVPFGLASDWRVS